MKKTDIGVVAFIYAVGVLFLVMTFQLPAAAQTYPLFIDLLLLALTTAYLVRMVIGARRKGVTSGLEDFQDFLPGQFCPILGMVILYLAAMYVVGFYPATVLFMVGCLLFLRVPKWQILLSTAAVAALVYFAFTMFLRVRMPAGLLFR